jgi:acetyl esterase/lipase
LGRDPECLRLVRAVGDGLAASCALSLEEERAASRRSMARAPRLSVAATRELEVPAGPLRARLLVPADPLDKALVYVHGGGGWYPGGERSRAVRRR